MRSNTVLDGVTHLVTGKGKQGYAYIGFINPKNCAYVTIKNPRLRGVKQFPIPDGRYIVFLFDATDFEGGLRDSEEGSVAWYPRDQLKDLSTVADLEELIQVMERDDLNEFIYLPDGENWQMFLR